MKLAGYSVNPFDPFHVPPTPLVLDSAILVAAVVIGDCVERAQFGQVPTRIFAGLVATARFNAKVDGAVGRVAVAQLVRSHTRVPAYDVNVVINAIVRPLRRKWV